MEHRDRFEVGIMADSHGQAGTIDAAIAFLKERDCRPIYHLGDICDSFNRETVEYCVRLLRENDIKAIKGNNDHAVVVNEADRKHTAISSATYRYLRHLPSLSEYRGAIFTHSLPFVKKLGLSAMIGQMGTDEATRFFESSPRGILFRGHGHSPEIMWRNGKKILSSGLSPEETIDLADRLPCVVTCGALTDGLCMTWNPETQQLTALSFLPTDGRGVGIC